MSMPTKSERQKRWRSACRRWRTRRKNKSANNDGDFK